MTKIHIISSGTGVGKTFITTLLCNFFNQRNENYFAIKPVISGFEFSNKNNDLYKIIDAQDKQYSKAELKNYSAFIYKKPLSPDQAVISPDLTPRLSVGCVIPAKSGIHKINSRLDSGLRQNDAALPVVIKIKGGNIYSQTQATIQAINNFVNHTAKNYNKILIEGVGGICVPLNKSETYIDFIKQSFNKKSDKIILVLGSYLGSLSHSITTLKTLELYNLKPRAIIVTQNLTKKDELYIDVSATIKSLSNFTSANIIGLDFITSKNKAQYLKNFYERISEQII